jgi:hypothetical protein
LALLNKQTRRDLPGSGLLDQVKVLKVKAYPKNIAHLQYAFNLADVIAFDICNMKTKVAGFDLERVASTTQRTQTNYLTKDQYMEILCQVISLHNCSHKRQLRIDVKIDTQQDPQLLRQHVGHLKIREFDQNSSSPLAQIAQDFEPETLLLKGGIALPDKPFTLKTRKLHLHNINSSKPLPLPLCESLTLVHSQAVLPHLKELKALKHFAIEMTSYDQSIIKALQVISDTLSKPLHRISMTLTDGITQQELWALVESLKPFLLQKAVLRICTNRLYVQNLQFYTQNCRVLCDHQQEEFS